ncbi:tRNA preQ1(34) S-adenosylmethionine ribosyltransferase-isomerase QueA [Candidatus Peregrinibacteria bacterium]|nr:tRNA preQ1(34) S-adenosylmethionine ribosyltransferase-isomerase QueA [Candidatus Peregrinibacteria bacterium]
MKTSDFDYNLLKKFIAMAPSRPRDSSKLMVLNRKKRTISHKRFYDLPEILNMSFGASAVLVFNDSSVMPVRILFKEKGAGREIFIHKKVRPNIFECLVKPGRKFRPGTEFRVARGVRARVINVHNDGMREIRFSLPRNKKLENVLKKIGSTPFPPYLSGTRANAADYQTIYAKYPGSSAAPTAGLHFTKRLMKRLKERGVGMVFTTLHVGLGTFQPVKTERIKDHKMHSEFFTLGKREADFLNRAKLAGKKIIAVGTTSVRVLETCADAAGKLRPKTAETDIFIYPSYKWKFIDGMITNFHLPKSTLIMLVSAFAGKDFVFRAYKSAQKHNYRFYSFGDAMLIM